MIPQSDGAGVIDQVGDGIATSRIGERVWVWNGQWKRAFGTAAQYIALPAAQAVKLPRQDQLRGRRLSRHSGDDRHPRGSAGGAAKGTTLLIAGGAGAVSQYAIQFAKAQGATVITTVSSDEKAAAAREAGADHTIDYKRDDVGERVMEITGKRGVDAVMEMDLSANAKLIPFVLRPKGSVIVYGTGAGGDDPAGLLLAHQRSACNSSWSMNWTPANASARSPASRARLNTACWLTAWRARLLLWPTPPAPMRRWSAAVSAMWW